jgi:ribosomal-protein-alanine N-acetyltransferase
MEIHITKTLSQTQFDQIIKLWNAEYPIKLQNRFELLLIDVQNYNHYLIEENNQILAWAVAFDKENETRFSIIVKDEHKGKGLGTLLIEKLKFELGEFYGWVIDHDNDLKANGEVYKSPLAFYQNKGFEVLYNLRIDNEVLKAVKIKSPVKVSAETSRFILREIIPSDLDGLFELDSDADVHRYLGNEPVKNKEQIAEVIQFIRNQYLVNGIGRWAIIEKNTNNFVGWTGLKLVTEMVNKHQNYYDLGYRIIRKYWGKGIATETARAVLDYGFKNLNVDKIYSIVHPQNESSKNVLHKLGFIYQESFDFDNEETYWYNLDRSNW